MKNLVFIVGPTAVGKTDWAQTWGSVHPSGIINADSIQAYRELNIGSAKPDFKSHPHISYYLFNTVEAPQIWTAGHFRKQALNILKKELPKKHIFVVGGSGFYIQALEKGMYPIQKADSKITDKWRKQAKEKGLPSLYELLEKQDPDTAKQIHPKDRYRILRALSIMESEGKTISQIKKEFKEQKLPYSYNKVALSISKEDLLKRVKERTHKMLKEGFLEEIESLLKRGLKNWQPLNSVGYKEGRLYLGGKIKKEELAEKIVSSTMALAKKQKTWFKRDQSIKWFDYNRKALKVYKELFQ